MAWHSTSSINNLFNCVCCLAFDFLVSYSSIIIYNVVILGSYISLSCCRDALCWNKCFSPFVKKWISGSMTCVYVFAQYKSQTVLAGAIGRLGRSSFICHTVLKRPQQVKTPAWVYSWVCRMFKMCRTAAFLLNTCWNCPIIVPKTFYWFLVSVLVVHRVCTLEHLSICLG